MTTKRCESHKLRDAIARLRLSGEPVQQTKQLFEAPRGICKERKKSGVVSSRQAKPGQISMGPQDEES